MCHTFPRPPGAVGAAKLSRELVEVFAGGILALFQREFQGDEVVRGRGQFLGAGRDDRGELAVRGVAGQRVVDILAGTPVLDQPGFAELAEVHGNARLPEPEDLLNLHDGELFALQKQEQAQPRFICDEAQGFYD